MNGFFTMTASIKCHCMQNSNLHLKPRDLAIHGTIDRKMLREAKASLSVDWQILPRSAQKGDWRVLAAEVPDWVCEYAYSPDWTVPKLADAILSLCGNHEDARVVSMARSLEKMFDKRGVIEIE